MFIRPVVGREASLDGDLADYRRYLPDSQFFHDTRTPFPCVERALDRLENRARDYDCAANTPPNPVVTTSPVPPAGAPR